MHGLTMATWLWLEDLSKPAHQLFVTIDPGWTHPRSKSVYDIGIVESGEVHFAHRKVFGRRTTPVIKAKVWTHLAATYNVLSDEVKIYVNGNEFDSFTRVDKRVMNELSQDWSEQTAIGHFKYQENRVRSLRGRVDEFYMYPCALSAEHVKRLKDKKCEESMYSFFYANFFLRFIQQCTSRCYDFFKRDH